MPEPLDATWTEIRAELRGAVSDSTFHLWLEPLTLEAREGDRLLVGAPDSIRSWVSDRYARVLAGAAASVLGPAASVTVVPSGSRGRGAPAEPAPAAPGGGAATRCAVFNPRYTFEQFVIGEANRFAHAAALAVAEQPGQAYNPLFLYGPPGLGKTHLLHAIANYLAAHEPTRVVRYTTAESFTNHFLDALGTGEARERFKALYRGADVLLIDDVQFLERKLKTEEEFFHTFAHLYEGGAQLVLTSDRLPHDLAGLEDRLRERFASGLVADVHPPDHATRMTILRKRVSLDQVPLAEEAALSLIAERAPADIRGLEGALVRIVAFHSLTRRPIDLALATQVLDGLYPQAERSTRHTVADVQAAASRAFGVTVDELCSPSRAGRIAWPRQVAMYLARERTDASLPAIGRAFGGRNHATVLHACRRARERIAADRGAFDDVDRVARGLASAEGSARAD